MSVARIAVLALAAVAVGAIAGVLLLGRDDDERGPVTDVRRTFSVRTSLEPREHLFGDPIVAHVDLEFHKRRVDPGRILVDTAFRPYDQVGRERRERSEIGDTVKLRISYPLQCLARACTPGAPRRELRFPPVRVIYRLVEAQERATAVAEWPPLDVASRLGPFDIQEASWRADLEPPAVSYRMSPGRLAAALGGASLVLVGAAALLAWRLLERRPGEVEEVPAERRPPLERALYHVGLAAANGDVPERRRALERLARELDRVERTGLAARTRRLAWSPGAPDRVEVERLADDVRSSVGGSD